MFATSCPSIVMVPETLASGTKSMVRFRQRSRELLPDCAGPMIAKISFGNTSKEMPWMTS
jgi:hypothetical protein